MGENVDTAAAAGSVPNDGDKSTSDLASIAVFQYDLDAFSLKAPIVVPFSEDEDFTLTSTSVLWKKSMMKRNDQELPMVSIQLAKNGTNGRTLIFPDGLDNLEVIVNNDLITSSIIADGFDLTGGELVKLYCSQWLRSGELVDERVGPLTFQYRPAGYVDQPPSNQKSLEQLPSKILKLILAKLPVDEVLYNIPAISFKFLKGVQEKVVFDRWEISRGWLTPQEAAFCQGWTASPVTHLKLNKVLITNEKEKHSFDHFLWTDMDRHKSSIESLEINLETSSTIPEDHQLELDKSLYLHFGQKLESFTALKSLKMDGFPLAGHGRIVTRPMPSLEKMWIGFQGNGCDEVLQDLDRHMFLPNLKRITCKLSLENHLVTLPELEYVVARLPHDQQPLTVESAWRECLEAIHEAQLLGEEIPETIEIPPPPQCALEHIYGTYAPLSGGYRERTLILVANGTSWKTCETLLGATSFIDNLSLTIDTAMSDDDMKLLINSLPKCLATLQLAAPLAPFDDKLCVILANRCPGLNFLWCDNASGVTTKGLRILLNACENVEGLALFKEENGVLVPRTDLLLAKGRDEYVETVHFVKDKLEDIFG